MRPKAHPPRGSRREPATLAFLAIAALLAAAAHPLAAGATAVVAGRVVDAAGHPVAGAKATVVGDGEKLLGSAVTGTTGQFAIALRPPIPAVTVQVDAAGFDGWLGSPRAAERGSLKVVLARQIDRAFVGRLVALPAGNGRRDGLIEVLAAGSQQGFFEAVFPALGALRPDLRGMMLRPPPGDDGRNALRDGAAELLTLWGDPADAELLAPWLEKNPTFRQDPPEARGATLAAACQAWTAAHFAAEHAPQPWTWHVCGEPVLDPSGTRALVRFDVRYAHWFYGMYLVFARHEKTWTLRTVTPGWIS